MRGVKRELTDDQVEAYRNGEKSANTLAEEVATVPEKIGYGFYGGGYITQDGGKTYVNYSIGDTCD